MFHSPFYLTSRPPSCGSSPSRSHRATCFARLLHRRSPITDRRGELGGEGGFVMVFIALTLVDHARSSPRSPSTSAAGTRARPQLKRAADAAALAGVVWMPEFDHGAAVRARHRGPKNGFVDGQNNISVDVSRSRTTTASSRSRSPTHKAKQFFSKLVTQQSEHLPLVGRRSTCCRCLSGAPRTCSAPGT